MRRAVSFLFLISMVVAGPLAASGQEPATPAATPRLETLLPGDTFLVATMPDVSRMCDQFSRTALAKLWREPEVQAYLAPARAWLERKMKQAEKQMGHRLGELLGMFHGQLGVAVIEFDPMFGGIVPDAVLFSDMGAGKADAQAMVAGLIDRMGDRMAVRERAHAGFTWMDMTLPMGLDVSMAWFGNAMVVTTRPDRMPKLVDAWQNGLTGNLTENPTWQAAMEKVGGGGNILGAFVNVEAILDFFGDRMDPQVSSVMSATGLSGVKALAMGSSFAAEGIRDTFFAYVPGEKRGIVRLFYTAKGDGTGLLRRVPKGAFWASAGKLDLDGMMDGIMEIAETIDPSVVDQIQMGLAQAGEMIGIDIRDDLLRPLGDEMAFYMTLPDGGGLVPDIVMLVKLDDPARFENALTQVAARAKMMLEDTNRKFRLEHRKLAFMGKTIHYMNVSHRRGDPFPVTPSFLIDGNLLAVALFPQPLKDFVARGAGAPSLFDRPDFTRVMKGLPDGMTSVEYVDLGAAIRLIYGSLVPLYQAAGKAEKCPMDPALIPRTETVAKHFFGAAWGMKTTDQGIEFHAYSQVGFLPMVAASALPVLWLGAARTSYSVELEPVEVEPQREGPTPSRQPEVPVKGNPRAQLKEIYIALLYQYAEKNAYPENLGALVTSRALVSGDTLLLPGDDAPLATGGGAKTSFAYVGPKVGSLVKGTDRAVWVYQRDGLSPDARWVLFADSTVRRVPEAQFQKLLAETRKLLAK